MKYIIFCIMLAITVPACATPQATPDKAVIARAQEYLNSIQTIQANFTQIAPDGNIANGTFYMQRPGKMRWQYNPPVPVLMVSRGDFLRYIDYELEQVSDIPLDGTIASVLASKIVDFDDDNITILRAAQQDGVAIIKLTQTNAPDEGELSFEFETAPYTLRNILLKDAKGEETNISLSNASYNVTLEKALFSMEDPRITIWRKNRR